MHNYDGSVCDDDFNWDLIKPEPKVKKHLVDTFISLSVGCVLQVTLGAIVVGMPALMAAGIANGFANQTKVELNDYH